VKPYSTVTVMSNLENFLSDISCWVCDVLLCCCVCVFQTTATGLCTSSLQMVTSLAVILLLVQPESHQIHDHSLTVPRWDKCFFTCH